MADQVRIVDREFRLFEYIETLPAELVAEVRGRLAILIGIALPTDWR